MWLGLQCWSIGDRIAGECKEMAFQLKNHKWIHDNIVGDFIREVRINASYAQSRRDTPCIKSVHMQDEYEDYMLERQEAENC